MFSTAELVWLTTEPQQHAISTATKTSTVSIPAGATTMFQHDVIYLQEKAELLLLKFSCSMAGLVAQLQLQHINQFWLVGRFLLLLFN